jgi:hypothetical protein
MVQISLPHHSGDRMKILTGATKGRERFGTVCAKITLEDQIAMEITFGLASIDNEHSIS